MSVLLHCLAVYTAWTIQDIPGNCMRMYMGIVAVQTTKASKKNNDLGFDLRMVQYIVVGWRWLR